MSDRISRQQKLVAEHVRGENEKDWQTVYDTFVQDDRAHFYVVSQDAIFPGIDGIRGFYQSIVSAIPDFHVQVCSQHDFPGCTILEVVVVGTHTGEFAGAPPLGNTVRINMAVFYVFDDNSEKLISERLYFDQAILVDQMRRGSGAR